MLIPSQATFSTLGCPWKTHRFTLCILTKTCRKSHLPPVAFRGTIIRMLAIIILATTEPAARAGHQYLSVLILHPPVLFPSLTPSQFFPLLPSWCSQSQFSPLLPSWCSLIPMFLCLVAPDLCPWNFLPQSLLTSSHLFFVLFLLLFSFCLLPKFIVCLFVVCFFVVTHCLPIKFNHYVVNT